MLAWQHVFWKQLRTMAFLCCIVEKYLFYRSMKWKEDSSFVTVEPGVEKTISPHGPSTCIWSLSRWSLPTSRGIEDVRISISLCNLNFCDNNNWGNYICSWWPCDVIQKFSQIEWSSLTVNNFKQCLDTLRICIFVFIVVGRSVMQSDIFFVFIQVWTNSILHSCCVLDFILCYSYSRDKQEIWAESTGVELWRRN